MRAAPVLLASIVAFAAIEGAVFHTGVYPWILNPDASTGYMETILRNERERPKNGPQVLGIGDSRMLLMPRLANQHTPETGYTFGSIATRGGISARLVLHAARHRSDRAPLSGDRDWRWRATMTPTRWDDEADSEADLSYMIARLRLSDLWEFSRSYDDPELQWKAARGILFKGPGL